MSESKNVLPQLKELSAPVKALLTALIITLSLAMFGAVAQIIVHDIIPTFSDKRNVSVVNNSNYILLAHLDEKHTKKMMIPETVKEKEHNMSSTVKLPQQTEPLYESFQFVTILKWTHIHLFGMAFIFILLGCITVLLPYSSRTCVLLVVLPFVGILIDVSTVWLKNYVSPAFFWMHLPGGGLMFSVFGIVSLKGLWEMWFQKV